MFMVSLAPLSRGRRGGTKVTGKVIVMVSPGLPYCYDNLIFCTRADLTTAYISLILVVGRLCYLTHTGLLNNVLEIVLN